MKISIKEIKVEHDGSELLYVRDIGFIVKSETFSGVTKECQKQIMSQLKAKHEQKTEKKEQSQTVPIEQLIPVLLQMFSQWSIKSKGDEGKSEPGNIEQVEKPLEELKKEPGG